MLLTVILVGQICVVTNHTLAFDHMMKAHLINFPVIRGKRALLTCDSPLIYSVVTGKKATNRITE